MVSIPSEVERDMLVGLQLRPQLLALAERYPRAVRFIAGPVRELSQRCYDALPPEALRREPLLSLGRLIQKFSFRRYQNISTCFLRNRPELQLLGTVAERLSQDQEELRLAVLGCSTGPEAFSAVWSIQSACPSLHLKVSAVDIEEQALAVARRGEFAAGSEALKRLDESELERFFAPTDTGYRIRESISAPIDWIRADVRADDLPDKTGGLQDIVLANRFLCHMEAASAEDALRRIVELVRPGGYLFVSGVDPDVRVAVATEYSLAPLVNESEAVYAGDPSLVNGWPTAYWALEPFNRSTENWRYRYAPVFQRPWPHGTIRPRQSPSEPPLMPQPYRSSIAFSAAKHR